MLTYKFDMYGLYLWMICYHGMSLINKFSFKICVIGTIGMQGQTICFDSVDVEILTNDHSLC